jgi:CDP-diacylglycerol---glycerol-3-phosphate 3-phosphatidyltransferase
MPTIYQLKPAFQNLLRPLVRWMAARGVTANQVTVAGIMLSLAWGAAVVAGAEHRIMLLALPAVLLVRMALNAVDGMLAREFGQQSALGGVLNELGDVVSDAALYLPLALVEGFTAMGVVAVVFLAGLSEMAGLLGLQTGAGRRYDGPCGKSDRAFLFGLLALLLGLGVPVEPWIPYLLGAFVLLLVWTIFNRARGAVAGGVK